MIPPLQNGRFVAGMERILDVYKRAYDPLRPVVCMDESPKQLIGETKTPIRARPGRPEMYDCEYRRLGTCNIFMACEPLKGKRIVRVTETKTMKDWARFLAEIADHYRSAEKITLVMDNFGTHEPGALYETFSPEVAKALRERFEFEYTPKHGSWLNIAEIELNVLHGQCLKRRIDNIDMVRSEVNAWQDRRNNANSKVNWQFTTKDARIKLSRLYQTLQT